MSFKFLTLEERNRRLEAENNLLRGKNQQLEEAILELAQIISEAQNGEVVPDGFSFNRRKRIIDPLYKSGEKKQ